MAENNHIIQESMLRTGALLHGTYRIHGYLSSGGFGNTYVATHVNFKEKRAVKEFFMKGVSQRDSNGVTVSVSNAEKVTEFIEQLEKFKKEAYRLRNFNNDHIVRVYDMFEENGTAYYVMDFIEGENLKDRLARTNSPMSEGEVLDVLRQILDALNEVHAQGIWHMDLKPANVMMDTNGVVKLIDFGASKQFDIRKGGALSTSAVTFTNGYAPFEQMERSYEKFGPWTDFYALGATLYNLLTSRRPPMPSDINDDMTADKRMALPMPGTISTRMRDLVLWLMRPKRVDRPKSVEQIFDYLDNPSARVPFSTTDAEATVISRPDHMPRQAGATEPLSSPVTVVSPAGPKKMNLGVLIGIIAAALVIVISVVLFIYENNSWNRVYQDVAVEESNVGDSIVENMKVMISLGECLYTGGVDAEGLPVGHGTAVLSDNSRCEANFVHGEVDGPVVYYFPNGDTFVGTFKNNVMYEGKYTKNDKGDYFVGTFIDNKPATGCWYDKQGDIIE